MTGSSVRATAPLRISFVGGGTDFPHYYERHGGAVVSATIDHCAHVDVTVRDDLQVTIRSLDLGHLVEYPLEEGPVYDGLMDLPKAAIDRIGTPAGIDVDIASDAPPGSGLGGSSALVTACVGALAALDDRPMSRTDVAHVAYAIEREDLGIAGGWQDQYAAAFGGFNLLEFGADGVRVSPLALDETAIAELRSHLLLCYTGHVRTDLGLIDTQIRMYAEGREETIVGMKQLHEMAYEMRDAIEAVDVQALGGLLREAYESKKRMNPRIAEGTPIEALLEVARSAGAAGGKICGAGGGGYLLLACEPSRRSAVGEAMRANGGRITDFAFRAHGVQAVTAHATWRPS
jgi:D-glycero-alpha-D-manno-heptose-7-phosphate kinase